MNDIQQHLIKLLKEIDEICRKNHIPYVLCGRTAKDACHAHKFMGEYVYASVLMHAKDMLKFRDAVKKIKDRAVESVLDYPEFPDGRAMRYVDENTTFLYGHLAHRYHHHGIYVTIQQCRSAGDSGLEKKLIRGFDKIINAVNVTELGGMSRKKRVALKGVQLAGKCLGKARVVRMLVRMQNLCMKKRSKKLAYIRPGKEDILLPGSSLGNVQQVVFEGENFRLPKDEDRFISLVWGKSWRTSEEEESVSSPHLLAASTDISYREVDLHRTLDENRQQVNRMIRERNALSGAIQALRKSIEKNWDVLFLTRERYRLYSLYKPVEAHLAEKLQAGDMDYLTVVMAPYLEQVVEYAGKGWAVQVSPVLDHVALELLKWQKQDAAAKKFGQALGAAALKPVTLEITDRLRSEAQENLNALLQQAAEETVQA